MKVSDAIAEFLSKHVSHVFTVSGGADLHIIDSIGRRDDIKLVCPQHEQSAGFAADAYARLKGLGVAMATSGPGATNLITPIAASYYDSVPVLYITGNQTRARLDNYGTRQYGFQATPITEMVGKVVKGAWLVQSEQDVISTLENAVRIAQENRRGPVLVDIPDDIQRGQI